MRWHFPPALESDRIKWEEASLNCGERACVVPCFQSQMAGIRGSWRGGMFACDVATAFAGVTHRGLPGVLIKITSGSDHVLICMLMGGGGRGCFTCVWLCGRYVCFVACVCESVFFWEKRNSCWGGVWDSRGELTLCSVVSVVWSWRHANYRTHNFVFCYNFCP